MGGWKVHAQSSSFANLHIGGGNEVQVNDCLTLCSAKNTRGTGTASIQEK
jgi:hypothetical protein